MENLSINEAVNVAQQMRNFFKAFKKLDEFIEFVVLTEQGINEKNKKKADLEEEIKSLEIKLEDLKSSYEGDSKEMEQALIAKTELFEEEKAKLKAELEKAKSLYDEEIGQLNQNLKFKRESCKTKIGDLDKREKEALDKALEAETKLEEIRKKIKEIEI